MSIGAALAASEPCATMLFWLSTGGRLLILVLFVLTHGNSAERSLAYLLKGLCGFEGVALVH